MLNQRETLISRAALALLVLLSGLAFLPFADLSSKEIGWQLYAGIYEPQLEVDNDRGAPGSAFIFNARNFEPNTIARVYVNGVLVGSLIIDSSGSATFMILTEGDDALGRYEVMVSTNTLSSDTASFDLQADEPLLPAPTRFEGPIFHTTPRIFLPIVVKF